MTGDTRHKRSRLPQSLLLYFKPRSPCGAAIVRFAAEKRAKQDCAWWRSPSQRLLGCFAAVRKVYMQNAEIGRVESKRDSPRPILSVSLLFCLYYLFFTQRTDAPERKFPYATVTFSLVAL